MQYKDDLIIRDERIFLKSMNREDSERYRILRNQEENRKWFFTDAQITEADQKKWFDRYYMDCNEYMFSIYEKISRRYLGAVGVYHIDYSSRRAEVGRIIVDRSAGGKGYGKEAVCCIVEWGRKSLGIKIFYAQVYTNNLSSIKTFLRCGFTEQTCYCEEKASQQILLEKIVK